jgi:hypothetical protein
MRKHGRYAEVTHERDHQEIVAEINRNSPEPIPVNVLVALDEYAIVHGFDVIPSYFTMVCTPTTQSTSGLYPGTTPWTTKYIYVKSAVIGLFHIIVRK